MRLARVVARRWQDDNVVDRVERATVEVVQDLMRPVNGTSLAEDRLRGPQRSSLVRRQGVHNSQRRRDVFSKTLRAHQYTLSVQCRSVTSHHIRRRRDVIPRTSNRSAALQRVQLDLTNLVPRVRILQQVAREEHFLGLFDPYSSLMSELVSISTVLNFGGRNDLERWVGTEKGEEGRVGCYEGFGEVQWEDGLA